MESTEMNFSEFESQDHREKSEYNAFGQIQAIYCKASKWPRVFPRPVVSSLPFTLPLCSLDTDQSNLEEAYLRNVINADWPVWGPHSDDGSAADDLELFNSLEAKCVTKQKAVLLRLFALAAKMESDWASLAIARLMPDPATVQLAIRYAGRLRRQNLAHRLAGVALDLENAQSQRLTCDQEEDEEEEDDDDGESNAYSHKPVNRKHNIPLSPISTRPKYNRESKSAITQQSVDDQEPNTSLVSSGTDDTHGEHNLSGLPLPNSEPISQSILDDSKHSRNPFRNSTSRHEPASSGNSNRRSDVFDHWEQKPEYVNRSVAHTKAANGDKKRNSVQTGSRKRKASSVAPEVKSEDKRFMNWFDRNREILEENNPDVSVEELVQVGRKEYLESTDEVDEKENHMFCKRPSKRHGGSDDGDDDDDTQEAETTTSKQLHSEFNSKASKRLSSFQFETK